MAADGARTHSLVAEQENIDNIGQLDLVPKWHTRDTKMPIFDSVCLDNKVGKF